MNPDDVRKNTGNEIAYIPQAAMNALINKNYKVEKRCNTCS